MQNYCGIVVINHCLGFTGRCYEQVTEELQQSVYISLHFKELVVVGRPEVLKLQVRGVPFVIMVIFPQ